MCFVVKARVFFPLLTTAAAALCVQLHVYHLYLFIRLLFDVYTHIHSLTRLLIHSLPLLFMMMMMMVPAFMPRSTLRQPRKKI